MRRKSRTVRLLPLRVLSMRRKESECSSTAAVCPLKEEKESGCSSTIAVCPLKEQEESDCSSTAATAGAPAEKECHISCGSATSSLTEDSSTSCTYNQEQLFVHRGLASHEYDEREYSAKKLTIGRLKATDGESAVTRAVIGKLPCQTASPMCQPSVTQNTKQTVSISTVQRAVPLHSNMSQLPLPEVKKIKLPAFPSLSNMAPLPAPPTLLTCHQFLFPKSKKAS